MSTFDWEYAGPFLLVCAAAALLIVPGIAKDVRAARDAKRAKAAQPEPSAPCAPADKACMKCGDWATHWTAGWRECDPCHDERVGRANDYPFDQDRSA